MHPPLPPSTIAQKELGEINHRVWQALVETNHRVWQAISEFEEEGGGGGDSSPRWEELKDSIEDLLSGSKQRFTKRKMIMNSIADMGKRGAGEEEEVSAEAEESLGDANVDALIAAVDETHFKMFRLNELESEQHQMVMALRSKLMEMSSSLRKAQVDARVAADGIEKSRLELAAVKMALKQTEDKLYNEKMAKEKQIEEAKAQSRAQVSLLSELVLGLV
ncbi:MAG: hypothetical protein SGPRY_015075 [Prymnesium sp.]